jgi:hypothetical protein
MLLLLLTLLPPTTSTATYINTNTKLYTTIPTGKPVGPQYAITSPITIGNTPSPNTAPSMNIVVEVESLITSIVSKIYT